MNYSQRIKLLSALKKITAQDYEVLYHGSRDPNLTKVNESSDHGFFNAIFACPDYDDAHSHGKYVYEIRLKKDEILEEIPEIPQVLAIIKNESKLNPSEYENGEKDKEFIRDLDLLWSVVGLEKDISICDRWVDLDDYKEAYEEEDDDEDIRAKEYEIAEIIRKKICNLLGEDELTLAWHEAQRIRGVIAKKLGYKAVSTGDEHGVSYIIMPSVLLKKIPINELINS